MARDWEKAKLGVYGKMHDNSNPIRNHNRTPLDKAKHKLRVKISNCTSNKERKKLIEKEIELNKK